MLRVSVIGLGVGAAHALAYERHPRCKLALLCDSSHAASRSVGKRFPNAARTTRWRDVIDDPAIDAVSIATYDDAHAEQVLAAIHAGKHVFVEKPMCTTLEEARAIRAALQAHPGMVFSSNLPLRLSPRFQWVRDAVSDGGFGELFHLEADYYYGRLHKLTDGWRGRIENYSVVLGGAVHMVDLVRWLSGRRVVEVSAMGSNLAGRRSGLRVFDHVVALLRFEGGMTAKVSANFGCVRPHEHGLKVFGTRATFENGLNHGLFCTSREPGGQPTVVDAPHPGAGKGDQIASFVDAALGVGTAIVPVDEVFQTMCVCLAIDRSAREGQPASVDYV